MGNGDEGEAEPPAPSQPEPSPPAETPGERLIPWSPGIEKPLQYREVLLLLDEFLYRGEVHEFATAQQSFQRIAASLGAEDLDAIIPPCLEVLEMGNRYIRNDTLLCVLHVSMGCMMPDAPLKELGMAMRRHAALLAKHEAMPVLVRALDNLLGVEDLREEDGIYEREFRLILNIIYLQLLFNEDDRELVKFLEQGCGRMGASLSSLLFEAAMNCLDTERVLPIKKVILLYLRVLQRLLVIPDKVLYPSLEPRPGDTTAFQRPRVMDFQAFTSLHSHQRQIRAKYSGSGYPTAVEEGLRLAEQYEDEFLASYSFHPTELEFMKDSEILKDAYLRYEELRLLAGTDGNGGRLLSRKTRKALRSELHVTDIQQLAAATASLDPSAGGDVASASTSRESSLSSSIRSQASIGSAVTEVPLEPEGVFKEPPPAARGDEPVHPEGENLAAIWQRLYTSMFPRLTELVVLLLRLLLTSCSNVDTYSGIVDFARERKVADAEAGGNDPFAEAEAQRHREILASAVAGVILILLKSARRYSSEDFAFLSQLVAESNGALVVLKYLNQDMSSEQTIPPVLPCLQAAVAAGKRLPLSACFWQACGTLRLVEVLYLVCRDCPERVRKYLIHYRAPFILKRLNRVESPRAQRLVLKLLKKQVRYLPRKWRQANMKALSAIYLQVTMSPLEDWLLNDAAEQSMEGPSAKEFGATNRGESQAMPRRFDSDGEDALGYVLSFPEYVPRS